MDFVLTNHAQEELSNRGIPLQTIRAILEAPEQILEEDGLKVYQGRYVASNGKTYLLRVFINDAADPARVVTVYRTSKISKYWRE